MGGSRKNVRLSYGLTIRPFSLPPGSSPGGFFLPLFPGQVSILPENGNETKGNIKIFNTDIQ